MWLSLSNYKYILGGKVKAKVKIKILTELWAKVTDIIALFKLLTEPKIWVEYLPW